MITESMMYWITRLDGLNTFMGVLLGVCILISISMVTAWGNTDIERLARNYMRAAWLFAVASLFLATGIVFTPTTKEMAMIYAVPAISRSDIVREDIPELYELGVETLKEKLKGASNGDDNRTVQHRG